MSAEIINFAERRLLNAAANLSKHAGKRAVIDQLAKVKGECGLSEEEFLELKRVLGIGE